MHLLRSPKFVERPDPSFGKMFYWPTHKDPKGTVKTQSVFEGLPTSSPLESTRGFIKPKKKKMRMSLKASFTNTVSDDDFLLLEAFILEKFAMKEPRNGNQKFNDQVVFRYLKYGLRNINDFFLLSGCS